MRNVIRKEKVRSRMEVLRPVPEEAPVVTRLPDQHLRSRFHAGRGQFDPQALEISNFWGPAAPGEGLPTLLALQPHSFDGRNQGKKEGSSSPAQEDGCQASPAPVPTHPRAGLATSGVRSPAQPVASASRSVSQAGAGTAELASLPAAVGVSFASFSVLVSFAGVAAAPASALSEPPALRA